MDAAILFVQDATMRQRMDAGFRRRVPPTTQLVNFASHRTFVREVDGELCYVLPPDGMWEPARYVSMLMGEIPQPADDRNGYGPAGRGFIAHIDVPEDVAQAGAALRRMPRFTVRAADPQWTG